MSVLQAISENVRNIRVLQATLLARQADQITEDLKRGVKKPYKDLIDVSIGDLHRGGLKPLTFVRQVLAACFYPKLMESNRMPADVVQRAQWLLDRCGGASVGSYTSTAGIPEIVQDISEFIMRRDGGVLSRPENIFISGGSQWSITNMLNLLVDSDARPRVGVLTPSPSHVTTIQSISRQGGVVLPYYLCEEEGWALKLDELQRALDSAKGVCKPLALYVINPGNPTGHVQSRASMEEVVRFAAENQLFLLADEVYQDYVHGEGCSFLSYKRVVAELGAPLSHRLQMASFHSVSKGIMGECGLRGGYVELFNVDQEVLDYVYRLFSIDSCAPVAGQLALGLMSRPPQPGEPSHPSYQQESWVIRTTLVRNMRTISQVLSHLPGLSCQPVEGGAYMFPRLQLPVKAIQKAQEEGMEPDTFYCLRLLEEAGVWLSPGSEFTQKDGTYHIRISILTSEDTTKELLRRLTAFHWNFMKEFS